MYFNVTSLAVASADASVSFTTLINFTNYDNGAVEVVFSGLDAADGFIRMQASIDGTNFTDLTTNATTFLVAASNCVFNFTDVGYNFVRAQYDAGANAAGTIIINASKKSRK